MRRDVNMAIEKVSKFHPDKIADRIAGAIVDLACSKNENATCAVEVLIGHGKCFVEIESSELFKDEEIKPIVDRISECPVELELISVKQDPHLAENQSKEVRCGDNGIFKGVPLTDEEREISRITRAFDEKFPTDGKYILDDNKLIVCQSNATEKQLRKFCTELGYPDAIINPLGEWTGGSATDCGATNRKLGSDMAQSVTGGGLFGKCCSKSDVTANIWAFVKAQELNRPVEMCCAIGDTEINGVPYKEMVEFAKDYIRGLGNFEAFAEYGLY